MPYVKKTSVFYQDILDGEFIFTQLAPSNSWSIEHRLNRIPVVTILDNNNRLIEGSIQYIDNNNLIITFNQLISGKAICS